MKVAKWGNSLAVRLPAQLVQQLGLKEGDQIDLRVDGDGLAIARHRTAEEVLADLRRYRGRLAEGERLSQDEAHER